MLGIKFPYFKKDRILKIEMLENLRDFPRDILDIYSDGLSDGIIWGFTPKIDKEIITFSKGITKYNGKVYLMPEEVPLSYEESEVEVVIKIRFHEELNDDDFKNQLMEIRIDDDTAIYDNEQELGRFKLKKGAYLRSNYQDLYDFTTEYNTINIVNVKMAGSQHYTMPQELLKFFARGILETKTENPIDLQFAFLCINSEKIERESLYNYLSYKEKAEIKPLTNAEIHEKLVKILNEIKRTNKGFSRTFSDRPKIIVD